MALPGPGREDVIRKVEKLASDTRDWLSRAARHGSVVVGPSRSEDSIEHPDIPDSILIEFPSLFPIEWDSTSDEVAQSLSQDFARLVRTCVTWADIQVTWFHDEQDFGMKLLAAGSRAIIALHDLDIVPGPDSRKVQRSLELKVSKSSGK